MPSVRRSSAASEVCTRVNASRRLGAAPALMNALIVLVLLLH
jgi:hypothetical protein